MKWTASRDAKIASESDLQASAEAMAVDGRNDELRRVLEPQQRLVGVKPEIIRKARVRLFEHVDVHAGAKVPIAVPGQDDDMHVVVEPGFQDAGVELFERLVRVSVERRIGQRDE